MTVRNLSWRRWLPIGIIALILADIANYYLSGRAQYDRAVMSLYTVVDSYFGYIDTHEGSNQISIVFNNKKLIDRSFFTFLEQWCINERSERVRLYFHFNAPVDFAGLTSRDWKGIVEEIHFGPSIGLTGFSKVEIDLLRSMKRVKRITIGLPVVDTGNGIEGQPPIEVIPFRDDAQDESFTLIPVRASPVSRRIGNDHRAVVEFG